MYKFISYIVLSLVVLILYKFKIWNVHKYINSFVYSRDVDGICISTFQFTAN